MRLTAFLGSPQVKFDIWFEIHYHKEVVETVWSAYSLIFLFGFFALIIPLGLWTYSFIWNIRLQVKKRDTHLLIKEGKGTEGHFSSSFKGLLHLESLLTINAVSIFFIWALILVPSITVLFPSHSLLFWRGLGVIGSIAFFSLLGLLSCLKRGELNGVRCSSPQRGAGSLDQEKEEAIG